MSGTHFRAGGGEDGYETAEILDPDLCECGVHVVSPQSGARVIAERSALTVKDRATMPVTPKLSSLALCLSA